MFCSIWLNRQIFGQILFFISPSNDAVTGSFISFTCMVNRFLRLNLEILRLKKTLLVFIEHVNDVQRMFRLLSRVSGRY